MHNHSLEERQYIEPGNTPIKKRTSSQSQVRNMKGKKGSMWFGQDNSWKVSSEVYNDSYTIPNEIEQKPLPLMCNKINSNSYESCLHS